MYRQSLYSHIINKTYAQKENRLCGNAHFKRLLTYQDAFQLKRMGTGKSTSLDIKV